MLVKLGVSIDKLNRQMRRALPKVEKVYLDYTNSEAVVTSTFEGNHGIGSLHYANDAADFRMPDTQLTANRIVDKLRVKLGRGYDVLISNNCIHIEWDPK